MKKRVAKAFRTNMVGGLSTPKHKSKLEPHDIPLGSEIDLHLIGDDSYSFEWPPGDTFRSAILSKEEVEKYLEDV